MMIRRTTWAALWLSAALVLGSMGASSTSWAGDRTGESGDQMDAPHAPTRSGQASAGEKRADKRKKARARRRADRLLAKGLAHYEARRFEQAIAAFRAGFRAESRPEFLFALAQAERRSGDCSSAIVYYQRFLATSPARSQARAARDHLEACQKALGSGPARGGSRSNAVSSNRDEAMAPPLAIPLKAQESAPWYRDTTGHILLGSGVVSVAAGVGFLAMARSEESRAYFATTIPDLDMHRSRARRHRDWSLVAAGAGVAFLSSAVLRYVTRAAAGSPGSRDGAPASASRRDLSIMPSEHGVAVGLGGRF